MENSLLGAIDFHYLLLENYKKFGINEKQLSVIFMVDHLLQQKNTLVTADLLALKMSLPITEIDQLLVELLNKNILEFDNSESQMKTTLEPLKKRLFREFQVAVIKDHEAVNSNEFSAQIQNIYQVFEKEFGRTLSPLEFSRIREWVGFGYTDEIIINALHEAMANNKKSIRSIDKILLKWATRDDVSKEGYSAVNEQWNKDIEKTIAIAQTKWVDEDDE